MLHIAVYKIIIDVFDTVQLFNVSPHLNSGGYVEGLYGLHIRAPPPAGGFQSLYTDLPSNIPS